MPAKIKKNVVNPKLLESECHLPRWRPVRAFPELFLDLGNPFAEKNPSKAMGLEAVEIIIEIEETFGIAITDAEASRMNTPGMLIAHVRKAVGSRSEDGPCLGQRAFYRIRSVLIKVSGANRSEISLQSPVRKFFPKPGRKEDWKSFCEKIGLERLPKAGPWSEVIFSPMRVRDLVRSLVSQNPEVLRQEREWSDQEVRQVIRMIISDYTDGSRFLDSDELVRDLGLG